MLERNIEYRVSQYAKQKGLLSYKFTSPNNKGVPDRLFIANNNKIFFIEFKRPNGQLSPLQEYVMDKFTEKKVSVYIVSDAERGFDIIDAYL